MEWTPEAIKELRLSYNLSQEDMAREAGVGARTWWRLEKGKNAPSYQSQAKLNKLADKLAIDSQSKGCHH